MKDLGTLVRENQAEAAAILNIMTNHGEKIISFIDELEGAKDTIENRGALLHKAHQIGNDISSDCPCVIVCLGDDLEDAYVYAMTNANDILVYCPNSGTSLWMEVSDCCNYSENDIYLHLDAIFNS